MAEFTGSACVVKWVTTAGGTVDLSGDMRSVSWSPSIKFANATAGSDQDEVYLATIKDKKVSYKGVMQSAGTATEDALKEGTFGTLIVQPEGTATGKRKYTVPAFSQGAQLNWPYDNTVEITCDFQGSGAATLGTN